MRMLFAGILIAAMLTLFVASDVSHENAETGTTLMVEADCTLDGCTTHADMIAHYDAEAQAAGEYVLKLPQGGVTRSRDCEHERVTGRPMDSKARHVLKRMNAKASDDMDTTRATRHEVVVLNVGVRA